jgi:hypothetical protein
MFATSWKTFALKFAGQKTFYLAGSLSPEKKANLSAISANSVRDEIYHHFLAAAMPL